MTRGLAIVVPLGTRLMKSRVVPSGVVALIVVALSSGPGAWAQRAQPGLARVGSSPEVRQAVGSGTGVEEARRAGTLSAIECRTFRTDAGACLKEMIARAAPGERLTYPAPNDGTCVPWRTQAVISAELVVDLGRTHFCAAGLGVPLLSLSASHVSLVGGRFFGDRSRGQVVLSVTGSQAVVQSLSCELVDTCVEQPRGAGFYNVYEHIFARNVATAVFHFEDGVGPVVTDMQYDTDNRLWAPDTTVSYDVPRKGCIWLQTEGMIFANLNATHCGDGLRVETTADRHVEWLKGSNSYFDSGVGAAGVHILNDQTGKKPGTGEQIRLRGLFFDNIWSATNTWGLLIEGHAAIDGVFWTGGEIHNNLEEGVKVDNPLATNIVLKGTVLSGNNAADKKSSNLFTNTAGFVACKACFFGRAMQWSAVPYDQVMTGEAQAGIIDLDGSRFDVAGVKHLVIDKRGTGSINIKNVEGVIGRSRGVAIIPAGQTAVEVEPKLNVPFGLSNILVSAAAATPAYVAALHETKSGQNFWIEIPTPSDRATMVTWDVSVEAL